MNASQCYLKPILPILLSMGQGVGEGGFARPPQSHIFDVLQEVCTTRICQTRS